MPLFSVPIGNDPKWFEAFVLSVDSARAVTKIQTAYGQKMDGVPWLSNNYDGPEFGDRVLVTAVTGTPIIIGVLSRIGDINDAATQINSAEVEADTGNYSTLSHGVVGDPDKPGDLIAGDKVISNSSGGLFGLLRGGTFIAKASRLSQILVSKYDDLVRVVARNWEIFSDACLEGFYNLRGRIYVFRGFAENLTNSRQNLYKYQEFYGDTVLGVNRKWNYYGLTPSGFSALPAQDNVIRKYLVVNAGGNTLFRQDLNYSNGTIYTIVQNSGGTAYTYVNQAQAIFDVTCVGGAYASIVVTPTGIVVDYNGVSTCTLNATVAELTSNGHFATIDAAGVHLG